MKHERFLKFFVHRLQLNFEMLKGLENSRKQGTVDKEFLAYCDGGIATCQRILEIIEDLNANEE